MSLHRDKPIRTLHSPLKPVVVDLPGTRFELPRSEGCGTTVGYGAEEYGWPSPDFSICGYVARGKVKSFSLWGRQADRDERVHDSRADEPVAVADFATYASSDTEQEVSGVGVRSDKPHDRRGVWHFLSGNGVHLERDAGKRSGDLCLAGQHSGGYLYNSAGVDQFHPWRQRFPCPAPSCRPTNLRIRTRPDPIDEFVSVNDILSEGMKSSPPPPVLPQRQPT